MKNFIQNLLIQKAKKLLEKNKPIIIAVTGSVGKTSTRNAIAAVLSKKYSVRSPKDNYNNEFGVPLTILDEKSPGKSAIGWLRILFKKISAEDFPKVFVLEYGADKPGDIGFLCDIAEPDVSVVTAISPVHAEHFGSIEELAEEKASIIDKTKPQGFTVLNIDDQRVMEHVGRARGAVGTYGFKDSAHYRAENYQIQTKEDFSFQPGEQFCKVIFNVHLSEQNQTTTVELPNHLGRSSVYSATAAIAVGLHMGMTIEEVLEGLKSFEPQAGRMRPIPGIKGSLILDDSYNAAPASMYFALDVLHEFHLVDNEKRIAALGFMAELGQYSRSEHIALGHKVVEAGVDLLVTVGEPALDIRRGAFEAGMDEMHCVHFADSTDAGRYLDSEIHQGDIILVKGSQSARMERVSKDLMAEPLMAPDLLVRQSEKWINE
ncbi:MAG: Mur ligase family protein [Patescibacteria group bacterium]